MGWTKTPSIDGYYWFTDDDMNQPLSVVRISNNSDGTKQIFCMDGENYNLPNEFTFENYYFFGPIEKPLISMRKSKNERNFDGVS